HRNAARRDTSRQWPGPADRERGVPRRPRQGARLRVPAEGRGGVFRRLWVVLLVDDGVLCATLEQAAERTLQMAERRLGWHAGPLVEPCRLRLAFEDGQGRRGIGATHALLALVAGVGAQPPRPVVDIARRAERPRTRGGLFWRRIEP